MKVNSVDFSKIDLLNSASSKTSGTINPFCRTTMTPDSFESSTCSVSAQKKSQIDILKQKFNDFLNLQQFNLLANKQEIELMMVANPKVESILQANGIKKNICLGNLKDIYEEHFTDCAKISKNIGKDLGLSKNEIKLLEKGALFHDFGKVLIPEELLNKPSKLTLDERKIVSLHANLGYELLKTTNFEPEVLEIIKNHHKYKYNLKTKCNPKLVQIVTIADIYSALISDRPYKKAMPPQKAFKILDKLVDENKLDKNIVNSLKKCVFENKTAI